MGDRIGGNGRRGKWLESIDKKPKLKGLRSYYTAKQAVLYEKKNASLSS